MKKKYSMMMIWALTLLSLPACKKFLTHDNPSGVTDAEWWKTESHAYGALGSVYAGIPAGSSGRNMMFWSGLSDEAVCRGDFKGNYDIYTRGLQNSTWDVAEWIWRDDYIDIRRACRFLENVDKCFMDDALRTRMKYEARALRAFYHMEIMLFFGDIPIVTTSVTPLENHLKRDPADKVYAFVLSELKDCAEHLPQEYDSDETWRISAGTCNALIAKLAIFYHHYDVARDAAAKVISSGVYKLYRSEKPNVNSFAELFSYTGELNKERIFFKADGCGTAWVTFAPYGIGGETYVSPTAAVVDNFETKQGKTPAELGADSVAIYRKDPNYKNNRDPRLVASILYPGEQFLDANYILSPFDNSPVNPDKIGVQKSTATGYWIRKYLDARDRQARDGKLDFMIIRYSEVLLIYVESLIELDDWKNPAIALHLNDIRTRAGMPAVDLQKYNSAALLRQLVRRERQSELAFEGQRYFDIRRWGIVKQVMNGQVLGATDPQTGVAVKVQDRSYIDRDYLWPIPEKETLSNPDMKQNPGY
ncbi:RagB/SusD family nutrient uptake outer membrane protein [Chitinophaga sp. RAB17]|uniref:RagB/SusD family nutrient uptake outer membrane protein n=1 Tax=Chitinophaga sp. RAB17 TaxID=3233049 RepID=UPI003F8F6CDF